MILKASLFRLAKFNYKTASKQKLNLFINTIIFISIFAISASFLSLYYENKIDKLDRKIILTEIQKIILENQISAVPNSLNSISLINESQHKKQSNIKILSEINPGGAFIKPLVSGRDKYFADYYDIITLVDISILENDYYLRSLKNIFKKNDIILKEINEFEKINNSNKIDVENIFKKASKTESDWLKFENKNLISKNGEIGIFTDLLSEGILVEEVVKGSPASSAKLKKGDIILSVNGKTFDKIFDKSKIEFDVKPNIPAEFIVKSNNQIKTIIITPREKYNDELVEDKEILYYDKFKEYFLSAKKILDNQEKIFLEFGLNFALEKLSDINNTISTLNKELEDISKNESRSIFFAFLIQLIIFFSSQYFEFSVGQSNEKKNFKR